MKPTQPADLDVDYGSGAQQLHVEFQGRVRWDDPSRAARAVTQGRGDDQRARAAFLHPLDALVPPLDHHAAAQREHEGLTAILAGIEFITLHAVLEEPTGVMHGDGAPRLGFGARPHDGVLELQTGSGGGERHDGVLISDEIGGAV